MGKGKSYVLPKSSGYQKCPQDSALLLQGPGALYIEFHSIATS